MPATDDEGDGLSVQGGALARPADVAEFLPKADLTYRTLEGLAVSDASLQQSLLTGSLVRSSNFERVNFARCDLDGMRLENSTFVSCDFSNVDLRSACLSGCSFLDCNFGESLVTGCTFANTRLERVSFVHAAVTETSFTECDFVQTDVARSSFVQNRFLQSRLTDMTLGDCTFLYAIMKGCKFDRIKINAESLGFIFGLTKQDVSGAGLVFLGGDEHLTVSESLIPQLVETYALRRWYLGVAIMRMNFELTPPAYALQEYLTAFRSYVSSGGLVKRDELQFLGAVFEDLAARERLPLMAWLAATETIASLKGREVHGVERAHTLGALQSFSNQLALLGTDLIDRFNADRVEAEKLEDDQPILLTVRFKNEPELGLAETLKLVAGLSGLPVATEPQTVERRSGSYVECVQTTLLSLVALQVFLFLVNGCLIQLTEARARIDALTRKKIPQQYALLGLQPKQQLPRFLAGAIHTLCGHLGIVTWLTEPRLKGYAPENLLDGTVEKKPPALE